MSRVQHGFIPPTMDADSKIWWEGLQRKDLLLQRCTSCGRRRCPPLPSCPYCGASESSVEKASGKGRIYTWVTVNRSLSDAFAGDEPYTILTVELQEGPRLFGRLLSGSPSPERNVTASFYEVDGTMLVGFEVDADPR